MYLYMISANVLRRNWTIRHTFCWTPDQYHLIQIPWFKKFLYDRKGHVSTFPQGDNTRIPGHILKPIWIKGVFHIKNITDATTPCMS